MLQPPGVPNGLQTGKVIIEPIDGRGDRVSPAATFFVKVTGHSMTGASIHDGDLLIVDRSIEAVDGKIVIAAVNGELTVKRLALTSGEVWLMPENPAFSPLQLKEGLDCVIWGVVTRVIHSL